MNLHLCLVLAQNYSICSNHFTSILKKHTPLLLQYKVQVCSVVTGWQDIITVMQHNAKYELFMPNLTLSGI